MRGSPPPEAGTRFTRLVVIKSGFRAPPTPAQVNRVINGIHYPMPGNLLCEVRCDCGTVKVVKQHALRTGTTKSCGCLSGEWQRTTGNKQNVTHGMKRHQSYGRHYRMMRRCYNPEDAKYHRYGARDVTVHEAWHSVAEFCHWLDANLGPCPEGHSLDRIDNDGNYEPGNVRWADAATQANNK